MKRLNIILSTLLCAVIPTALPAQSHTDANVMGHVLDARSGEHIPYATIFLKGTTVGVSADGTGHYFLKNAPTGEYELAVTAVGYASAAQPVCLEAGKTIEVNFTLHAASVDLEEVVVSASRRETNRRQAPTIVNIVGADLFEGTAAGNLSQALNYQAGLRMEFNCANCGVPQLRINGLEGQYTQVLLDSRPIFSSLAGVYGLEQLPAAMVERVEVIRGGGSALYGSSAIGGVVNIITREPVRNTLSLGNVTSLMPSGVPDVNTSLNGAFISDDARAGVFLFGMLRSRTSYDRDSDGFSDIPHLSSQTLGFRGYYKTSAHSKLTVEYHHIGEYRRGGDNISRPPHECDIAEQLRHRIDGGGLSFTAFTPDYRHRVNLYASFQNIGRDSYFGTEQNLDAYGRTFDRTFVGGAQWDWSIDRLLFLPSDLTLGVELNNNILNDRMLGYNRTTRQRSTTAGAFVQNEWKSERFNMVIGARLDKNNHIDQVVLSPRANVRYTPFKHVILRAGYSSGYRAPQAYDEDLHVAAVGGDVALIRLAEGLKPEYSHSLSASADLYASWGRLQANLLVEGFYTTLRDVFSLREAGRDEQGNLVLVRENASGAKVQGINLEGKLSLSEKNYIQAGYTLQRSRYDEPRSWSTDEGLAPHRRMLRTPDGYGYVVVAAEPLRRLSISLQGNYTGRMLVGHFAGFIERDEEVLTRRFWEMGMRLSYDFSLSSSTVLQLSCGVKNMLDQYQPDLDRGALRDSKYIYGPAAPRTFYFGLRFTI